MKTLALVIGIVWGISIVLVAIAGVVLCVEEALEAKARGLESLRSRHPEPRRPLEPVEGLLVPWSAVRASKRRLGVADVTVGPSDTPSSGSERPETLRRAI